VLTQSETKLNGNTSLLTGNDMALPFEQISLCLCHVTISVCTTWSYNANESHSGLESADQLKDPAKFDCCASITIFDMTANATDWAQWLKCSEDTSTFPSSMDLQGFVGEPEP